MSQNEAEREEVLVLPEGVPVEMPQLPARLYLRSALQFKAVGDPVRWRIIDIIQARPATAKQVADILKMSPGTIGHHLQVLEEAGLAQVVAKRLVRGIVAKYYTRTARVYIFDFPSEIKGSQSISVDMLVSARDQLQDALVEGELDSELAACGFPHVRLSAAQAREFRERVKALIDDFVNLEPDPEGQVYSLSMAFFRAPGYLQGQAENENSDDKIKE